MRVLLSAYACEPGLGSEPEIGWQALLAASSTHDVWLLTRRNNVEALTECLVSHPNRERIHIHGIDLGPGWMRWKGRLGGIGVFLYYVAWQRLAGSEAALLADEVAFDVVHHVTFAIHWLPVGVSKLGAPLVLGPVGRGLRIPRRLWPVLGVRGAMFEAFRVGVQAIGRRVTRETVTRAAVVITQNDEAAIGMDPAVHVVVFPNAAAVGPFEFSAPVQRIHDIAVVARVIPWKGLALAVRSLTHLPDATMTVYGDGPDEARIARLASRLGVQDRVRFAGALPRDEVFAALRCHKVLLHPSLREEAGMAVSEALSLGTPVVALDRGGPRVLVRLWPNCPSTLVSGDGSVRAVARRLAAAMGPFLTDPVPSPDTGSTSSVRFDDVVLSAYESARSSK